MQKLLTNRLQEFLGVKNLLLVANGTLAIQLAVKLFNLSGKVLTTPFTFPATTSALIWEGCEPCYCDIDFQTFNLDPSLFQESDSVTAVMATHVFGNPCGIEEMAKFCKVRDIPLYMTLPTVLRQK